MGTEILREAALSVVNKQSENENKERSISFPSIINLVGRRVYI